MSQYLNNNNNPLIKLNNNITFYDHYHYEIEILFLLEGEYIIRSKGKEYRMGAGDIFFAFPFVEHEYENVGENRSVIIIWSPEDLPEYCRTLMVRRPLSPVMKMSELYPGFAEQLLRMNGMFANHACSRKIIEGYISAVIGELLETMKFEPQTNPHSSAIESIMNYCRGHYTDPSLTISKAAADIGFNSSYISHILSQHIGIGFSRCINSMRIHYAYTLMRSTDKKITEIAYLSGFSSQRTFNRVFHEMTGMTPGEMRIQSRDNWENDFSAK